LILLKGTGKGRGEGETPKTEKVPSPNTNDLILFCRNRL
jgi:hypothetical protein